MPGVMQRRYRRAIRMVVTCAVLAPVWGLFFDLVGGMWMTKAVTGFLIGGGGLLSLINASLDSGPASREREREAQYKRQLELEAIRALRGGDG